MKLVDLKKIIRMSELIKSESTGCPEEFAKKLDFSRTTFFAYLLYLREDLEIEISYDAYRRTYYFEQSEKQIITKCFICQIYKKINGVSFL